MAIDWFTFLVQLVNFAVLIGLLHRFLYAPVKQSLLEREERTMRVEREARDTTMRAERERETLSRSREELEVERRDWLASCCEDAKRIRAEMMEKTARELDELEKRQSEKLQNERNHAIEAFSQDLASALVENTAAALRQLSSASLFEAMLMRLREVLQKLEAKELLRGHDANFCEPLLRIRAARSLTTQEKSALEGMIQDLFPSLASIGVRDFEFEVEPELIEGIEIALGSFKFCWTARDYLNALKGSALREGGAIASGR